MSLGINKYTVKEALNLILGQKGFQYINDTAKHTDSYFRIRAVNGSAVVSATSVLGDNLTTITLQQDEEIVGNFSDITLASGKVLAYYGSESS